VAQLTGHGPPTATTLAMRNRSVWAYGHEFFRAALKTRSAVVQAFLLGQALELYLKAYLHSLGFTEAQLKKDPYRHNIARLHAECEERGLGQLVKTSAAAHTDVQVLSASYKGKALQYFSLAYIFVPPRLPKLDRVVRYTRSLERALGSRFGVVS